MILYTKGNLLEADVDAVVNTVNTVGVMGKGIALMFKEAFPDNFKQYEAACKKKEIKVGHMFVVERLELLGGPHWIINFPTKKHWRQPTKLEWIVEGLADLHRVITENHIRSIAVPPLGCGNGGLDWKDVRPTIEAALSDLAGVDVLVFEPTDKYQNVAKRSGVQKLTPARALVAELIRRYWVLGIECTLLEIQKLAWFLERNIEKLGLADPLDLRFEANKYGPYAHRLQHLLNAMDGSHLHCEKRLADAGPLDIIWFDDSSTDFVAAYLSSSDAKVYRDALEVTAKLIDGFESPLGLELLATVDWLVYKEHCEPTRDALKNGLRHWAGGGLAAERKTRLFDDRLIDLAIGRLGEWPSA
ncbi:type II toxin-antitoxin system antitoxin DNA ADP-ribosyl glycohydrolase DarG [Nevskia soli]|uniref:type II toxin-antitoxin system antitoxin DNA ADP-ribosyl glycohydrolase DarG n=1 Tax=Nevskia soli TaxID=418856 RepID=UPI0004A716DA|nr:macro domain-containing protein [Nevskia soli]